MTQLLFSYIRYENFPQAQPTQYYEDEKDHYSGYSYETRSDDGGSSQVMFASGPGAAQLFQSGRFLNFPSVAEAKSASSTERNPTTTTLVARTIASNLVDTTSRAMSEQTIKQPITTTTTTTPETPKANVHYQFKNFQSSKLDNTLTVIPISNAIHPLFSKHARIIPNIPFAPSSFYKYEIFGGPQSSHSTYFRLGPQEEILKPDNIQPDENAADNAMKLKLRSNFNEDTTQSVSYTTSGNTASTTPSQFTSDSTTNMQSSSDLTTLETIIVEDSTSSDQRTTIENTEDQSSASSTENAVTTSIFHQVLRAGRQRSLDNDVGTTELSNNTTNDTEDIEDSSESGTTKIISTTEFVTES